MTLARHSSRTSSPRINPMRGALILALATPLPLAEWEKIEDVVAHALHLAGYRGSVFDSVTGNTTAICDRSRDSLAVQEVDWTKHMHTLFCPDCGDTFDRATIAPRQRRGIKDALSCNRCGKDAHGGSAVDEPTDDAATWLDDDTPLAEVLDDHPVEGIDY
jgi:hypothetical protein